MTRIAIVTGASQDHGFALAEELVSGRAAIACAASRAMSGARTPAQAVARCGWLPTRPPTRLYGELVHFGEVIAWR